MQGSRERRKSISFSAGYVFKAMATEYFSQKTKIAGNGSFDNIILIAVHHGRKVLFVGQ